MAGIVLPKANHMKSIKINFESLPTRCEICHQVDCFDSQTNQCSRCKNVMEDEAPPPLLKRKPLDYSDQGLIYGAVFGAIIGVLGQEVQNYAIADSSNSTKLSYWVIIGLALLCAFWGAAIGEAVKQYSKRGLELKKNTVVFNLWKH